MWTWGASEKVMGRREGNSTGWGGDAVKTSELIHCKYKYTCTCITELKSDDERGGKPWWKLYEWSSCQQDVPRLLGRLQQGPRLPPCALPWGDHHSRPTQPSDQAASLLRLGFRFQNSKLLKHMTCTFSPATVARSRWTCGGSSPLFGAIIHRNPSTNQTHSKTNLVEL